MAYRNQTAGYAANGVSAPSSLIDDLAKQMPQWRITNSNLSVSDSISAVGGSSEARSGVDIETLRAKFLKDRSPTDAIPAHAATRSKPSIEVFKVEPNGGGLSQVAERRDGKINIVSG